LTFSIITIVKNAPQDLEKTIDSVRMQKLKDYEYIVVDGGSDHETQEIIKKNKQFINLYISEPDEGIYFALNKGLMVSSGNWINFLNAGDIYASNETLTIIKQNLDVSKSLVFSNLYHLNTTGNLVQINQQIPFVSGIYFSINHQSAFFNKAKLGQLLLHDTTYKVAADTDLFFRVYFKDPKNFALQIQNPLIVYKLGGYSMKFYNKMIEERMHIVKKYVKNPILRHYNLINLTSKNVHNSRFLKFYNKSIGKILPIF